MNPTDVAAAVVIAIAFNLVKPYARLVVPTASDLYAPTLRLIVLVIGAVYGIINLWLSVPLMSLHDAAVALLHGGYVGAGAILLYHMVPGDFIPPELEQALGFSLGPAHTSTPVTGTSEQLHTTAQ